MAVVANKLVKVDDPETDKEFELILPLIVREFKVPPPLTTKEDDSDMLEPLITLRTFSDPPTVIEPLVVNLSVEILLFDDIEMLSLTYKPPELIVIPPVT